MTKREIITCPRCHGKGKIQKAPYKKGAQYEYVVKRKLEDKGYIVYRAYASRGVYDLIAIKGQITLGVQVKSLSQTNKAYLTPKDRDSLNKELNETDNYTLLKYDMSKHAAVEKEIVRPIKVIHAYKDGIRTIYRELLGVDNWAPFKP